MGRYLATQGADRVAKAVFIAPLEPYLLKTEDNPTGLDESVLEQNKEAAARDRYAWYETFFANFYDTYRFLGTPRLSEAAVRGSWNVAASSAPIAAYAVVSSWLTDFRADIEKVDVPSLILHGTGDRILPIDATAREFRTRLPEATYVEIEGAPHGLLATHPDEVNEALLAFLAS